MKTLADADSQSAGGAMPLEILEKSFKRRGWPL
jgi:hypothetical protein